MTDTILTEEKHTYYFKNAMASENSRNKGLKYYKDNYWNRFCNVWYEDILEHILVFWSNLC